METIADPRSIKISLAKWVAGLLFLSVVGLTVAHPKVLFPPILSKNQCYLCFKPATHTDTYNLIKNGKHVGQMEKKFCDSHGGGVPGFDASERLEGRGTKVFLLIAMIVLPICFLWGCIKIFFQYKTPSYAFWLLCFPLSILLLGIGLYLLGHTIAGRVISWIMLSLLMILWLVLFFVDRMDPVDEQKVTGNTLKP